MADMDDLVASAEDDALARTPGEAAAAPAGSEAEAADRSEAEAAAVGVRVTEFYPCEKKLVYVVETEALHAAYRRQRLKVTRKHEGGWGRVGVEWGTQRTTRERARLSQRR